MKVSVNALPEYKIEVTFDDGVSGVVDLKDLIGKGVFSALHDESLFNKVYATGYSIAWSEELEIDSVALYIDTLNEKSFLAKVQHGLDDVEAGRVYDYNDVKEKFLNL
jgi:esterase/lipase superfamily enzyme